jgi:hypothetical protein
MSVTIKVNGSSNSLVHKGSNGIANSTIPDVCKTPSPGGPVPIPYPVIVSMSSDLANGSTTVKADGGNMIGIKGCELSRCTGDEAGTAGGVKSSTFMKEAKFILYSFDVKIEGKNACRLSDKMTMNHENTMCLAGIIQVPVLAEQDDPECTVTCAIICCDEAKYTKNKHPDKKVKGKVVKTGEEMDCTSLSRTKHSCVLHSLREKNKSGKLTTTNKFDDIEASKATEALGEPVIPDIIVNGNHVIDCKFPCQKPAAPLNKKKCVSSPISSEQMDTAKEDTIYTEIDGVKKSEAMTPEDARQRHKKKKCDDCDCQYEDV